MKGYFADFPQIEYQGKIARNLMARPKIKEHLLNNPKLASHFKVQVGARKATAETNVNSVEEHLDRNLAAAPPATVSAAKHARETVHLVPENIDRELRRVLGEVVLVHEIGLHLGQLLRGHARLGSVDPHRLCLLHLAILLARP